jgi:threonine dehydratase
MSSRVSTSDIEKAGERLKGVVTHTPLQKNANISAEYGANIYLKREDLQVVRSYKIRGAYNLMSSKTQEELNRGVVCASAGNHAQGVAFSCRMLKTKGAIFMPSTTPKQKITQVKMFGKEYVEVILVGDTFDDSYAEAMKYCTAKGLIFIHPFDDPMVIAGQGTVALEILEDIDCEIDYIFVPIGGGGLSAGLLSYIKEKSPKTKVIGVEPEGAPAMKVSLEQKQLITLDTIDKFVDGAAVKRVGELNFKICTELLDDIILVPEGKDCTTILRLYNEEAIVVEPAGALSIAALDEYKDKIKGKNVVCVVSGSNNDIGRMEEIKERSLLYEGLKHYFIITFPQRAGALREFLDDVLGENDDITHFEYTKKNIKDEGSALVGVELKFKEDYEALMKRMNDKKVRYKEINKDPSLFNFLVM